MQNHLKIAIVGDGGWGTANALLLSDYGHEVTVWGNSPDYVDEIRRTRTNARYLPGVDLPESIRWTASEKDAVAGADVVVLAMPSRYFAAVCARFKGLVAPDALVVSLTKGLCEKTHSRMSQIAQNVLGVREIAVLSGPSHAEEVARGIPTAIVAASADIETAKKVQALWNGPRLRAYASADVAGVEVGGAVKNVIAIAVGCSDGLGFGDNTRAALITRGVAEIARLAAAYGADPRTVYGLSGIGDLVVTCTSKHSRNHMVGERLGRGEAIGDVVGSMKMVAEGVWNARVIRELANSLGVEMPITEIVYRMCYESLHVHTAISTLMNRSMKIE